MKLRNILLASSAFMLSTSHVNALSFTPGDYYATHYLGFGVSQYNQAGQLIDTINVNLNNANALSIRGISYGNDGLMYGVVEQSSNYSVVAFDETGTVHQTYQQTGSASGNISYGKITFDNQGHFYVSEGAGLSQFTIGDSFSANRLYTGGVFDVESLSNGNLLFATSYNLYEMDQTGSIVRDINLTDPNGLTGQTYLNFTDIRGIESNPLNGDIYLSMLGYSNFNFQTLRMNSDGQLLNNNYFLYGDDLYFTDEGELLVGSRTQSPGIFTSELGYSGSFEGTERMFVTQISAVPVPPAIWLFVSGLAGLLHFKRKRT